MKHPLIVIAALLAASAWARAQAPASTPAAQPPTNDASSVLLASKPAPPVPVPAAPRDSGARPASAGIAADLAANMPKYAPELAPVPKAGTGSQDLRDVDRPKNQIPRLPLEVMSRYVVHEARMPQFKEHDLYTKEGLIALSLERHPGLHFGNIFNLNSAAAFAAIQNEESAADRQDLVDTAYAMAVGGDNKETAVMQDAIEAESFSLGTQDGPIGGPLSP